MKSRYPETINLFSQLIQKDVKLESYIVLENDPRFQGAIAELERISFEGGDIGYDYETLGLKSPDQAFNPESGEIRLIQVYIPTLEVTVIWDLGSLVNRLEGFSGDRYDVSYLPSLKPLVECLKSPNVRVFIQNADFEYRWTYAKFGISIENIVDTLILSQVFWAGLNYGLAKIGVTKPNELKQIAFRLGYPLMDKTDQSFDYASPFMGVKQLNYAGYDPKITYQCGMDLLYRLEVQGMLKPALSELRAIPVFCDLRRDGYPVDHEYIDWYIREYSVILGDLQEIWDRYFPGCNIASSTQVLKCLQDMFPRLEFTTIDPKTKFKKPSSNDEALSIHIDKHEIFKVILNWRSVKKSLTDLETLKNNSVDHPGGWKTIRSNYNQLSPQATGRSSASSFAIQTVIKLSPSLKKYGLKSIRDCFRAPEGYKIIICDIDGCHGQIARYLSQDPALIEANKTGFKFHFFTMASILKLSGFDLKPRECADIYTEAKTKAKKSQSLTETEKTILETYDISKIVFYSFLNLAGAQSLQNSFKQAFMFYTVEQCKLFNEGVRQAYPVLYQFLLKLHEKANSVSHRIPVWFDENFELQHWGYYGKYEDNIACLQKPSEKSIHKFVGTLQGYYGEVRSFDGGRLFREKKPNRFKNNRWEAAIGDVVCFHWQRVEKTCILNAMSDMRDYSKKSPEWDARLIVFNHDEMNILVKEEYALDVAKLTLATMNQRLREYISDYTSEVEQAYLQYGDTAIEKEMIFDYWSK